MTKISVDELDALITSKTGEADILANNGAGQEINPAQTGENSAKPPALRKPIDAVIGAAGAVGTGIAAVGAGLANLKTNLPLNELK